MMFFLVGTPNTNIVCLWVNPAMRKVVNIYKQVAIENHSQVPTTLTMY